MESTSKEKGVKHKISNYIPNKIRAEPFKWINFPVFVGIWFVLFWFIVCPIVWSRVFLYEKNLKPHWTIFWPYYFWGVALLIFCVILGILVLIWKLLSPKTEKKYDQVFLNPQFGDGKEVYCKNCMKYHAPRKDGCNMCYNCGNEKESFGKCCEMKNGKNESSNEPVLRKQPDLKDSLSKRHSRNSDKRNSLKNMNSRSSGILISTHDSKTKELVNRNTKPEKFTDENVKCVDQTVTMNKNVESKIKRKKPPNLTPVDVELANKGTNSEILMKREYSSSTTNTENPNKDRSDSIDMVNYSSIEMDSMNKENFNKYLHLVEINTPFTPPENEDNVDDVSEIAKSPLSPREIFFYDLIQAAEKSDSNSPDSMILSHKYEKKRPISHILLTSDVDLDTETDEEKVRKMKSKTLGHDVTNKNDFSIDDKTKNSNEEKKFTVKVLQTVKKTIINGETVQTTVVEEKKVYIPKINDNVLSEQNSAQDIRNLKKESVSKYFISDINRVPPKPLRMTSQVDSIKDSNEQPSPSASDNVFD